MKIVLWLLLFGSAAARAETTIEAVGTPVNLAHVAIAFGIGCAIVGLIWAVRNHPGAVAKAKAETATLASAFNKLTETHAEAVAKIPAPGPAAVLESTSSTEPTPAVPPGKNGQAGPITFNATGDPAKDTAAFNALYFS